MRQAVVLHSDATLDELELPDEGSCLEQLQAAVEGYIEAVDIDDTFSMFLNEEGKYQAGLLLNPIATMLLHIAGGDPEDSVMGSVVITGIPDADGETQGLTPPQLDTITTAISRIRNSLL